MHELCKDIVCTVCYYGCCLNHCYRDSLCLVITLKINLNQNLLCEVQPLLIVKSILRIIFLGSKVMEKYISFYHPKFESERCY